MSHVLRYRALGIVFLALCLAGVWFTYAIFGQKFTSFDHVTMKTESVGLQLPDRADVKIRGVIVGEVLKQRAQAGGATLTLGIYPNQMRIIPANVTGSILPKTLFGEKYVALDVPSQPSSAHIEPGATIGKTVVATEVQEVLNDLYPLLQTIQPADLNLTLNAISTALEGRGAQLGQTIDTANAYLKKLNPQIPQLINDLKLTASVADTYNAVLPQIASILNNTITTTGTLQQQSSQLHQLLTDVTASSNTANAFLSANSDSLINLATVDAGLLKTVSRYSPEFPCLFGGVTNLGKRVANAFRGHTLHIVLETLPRQPRAYTPADKPIFAEDRGPGCAHLPNPPWSQKNPVRVLPNLNDGINSPTGVGTDRAATGFDYNPLSYAGSPAEADVLQQVLATSMGVDVRDVPALGSLLLGPMARGATVTVK